MVLAKKDKIRFHPLWCVVASVLIVCFACGEDDKLGVVNAIDTAKAPQLSTRNVSTLISDSGYTKYKVVTPLWNVYGHEYKGGNYWDFPEGVYLRQLDRDMKVVSVVAADSACYFPNKKLWELYGDVEIEQKDKTYFFSQRIFFDDKEKKISSDTFIHIKTPTQILEGIGFESNMELTRYRVLRPTGMFPMNQYDEADGIQATKEIQAPGPSPVPPFSFPHEPNIEDEYGEAE